MQVAAARGIRRYLATLPERLVRSVVGLGAGMAREVGEVAIPGSVRQSRLYGTLVEQTLRFLIEQVGGVEGVYREGEALADDFLARRTAGNAIEALGVVAFRASPVWVLAALADVSGLGRHLMPEIAVALKDKGLLEPDVEFTSVDEMLDGLERTSARLAQTINAPPLDVPALRDELRALRVDARGLAPGSLPSAETLVGLWSALRDESARQGRSVFETSSMLALAAVRSLPQGARWLSASALTGAATTGRVIGGTLLDDYRQTLQAIARAGYGAYARAQLAPYLRAAAAQFAPGRPTLTDRLLGRQEGKVR